MIAFRWGDEPCWWEPRPLPQQFREATAEELAQAEREAKADNAARMYRAKDAIALIKQVRPDFWREAASILNAMADEVQRKSKRSHRGGVAVRTRIATLREAAQAFRDGQFPGVRW